MRIWRSCAEAGVGKQGRPTLPPLGLPSHHLQRPLETWPHAAMLQHPTGNRSALLNKHTHLHRPLPACALQLHLELQVVAQVHAGQQQHVAAQVVQDAGGLQGRGMPAGAATERSWLICPGSQGGMDAGHKSKMCRQVGCRALLSGAPGWHAPPPRASCLPVPAGALRPGVQAPQKPSNPSTNARCGRRSLHLAGQREGQGGGPIKTSHHKGRGQRQLRTELSLSFSFLGLRLPESWAGQACNYLREHR